MDINYYLVESKENETVRVYINDTVKTSSGMYQFLLVVNESVCRTNYTIPVYLRIRQGNETQLELTLLSMSEFFSKEYYLPKPEPDGIKFTNAHIASVVIVILFLAFIFKIIKLLLNKKSKKRLRFYHK